MPRYIAVIDGEAGAYGAAFPDCLGCTAMGKTTDEAIVKAGEALREWMADCVAAGLTPPEPRSADMILATRSAHVLSTSAIVLVSILLEP